MWRVTSQRLRDLPPSAGDPEMQDLALDEAVQPLPWFVMPLAGPFGLLVAATMTWLNLASM